jgi:hypothetical protein
VSEIGSGGSGGNGGGGVGADNAVGPSSGVTGTLNTGGGGGGGVGNGAAGSGGSGIVIIAYPSSFADLTSIGYGIVSQSWNGSAWVNNLPGSTTPNTTIRPGYKVYRFSAGTGDIQW